MKKLFFFIVLFVALSRGYAQNDTLRLNRIRGQLDSLVLRDSAYRSEVDISVGAIPLSELLRNIAKINRVNLVVKDSDLKVSCNFSRARIDELLHFLCREYDLDLAVTGNIVSLFPRIIRRTPPPELLQYRREDSTLTYDFINASLPEICKKISALTGTNLIVPKTLYGTAVSGYASAMPLEDALYTLASVNGLEIVREKGKNIWNFSLPDRGPDGKSPVPSNYVRRRSFSPAQLTVDSTGRITAAIERGNIYDILLDICDQLKLNYFFITPVTAQTGIYIKDIDPETFFTTLFTGTSYSYYREENIYMFGASAKESALVTARVVPLKYRAADKLADIIPPALKEGVHVQMFGDLNSIIISGDQRKTARVERFLESVDKTVPLITIDIIIAEVSKNRTDEAGISLGKGDGPVTTSGTLSPGVDMTLGAGTINRLLNNFNGFGAVKLGQVSSDLFLNLKFMEAKGDITLQSTPKLSTLNGHEAVLQSGETKYYKEVNNTYMGTQNPVQSSSYTWKSVDASLTIKITPYVSADRRITLDIELVQSEFTEREEKEAPPGTTTRSFKSLIRVENQEVVLLGGIERNSREKSSRGLPFIARIPVLKWIFGSTKDNKSEHKLNIFIKPSLID